MKPEPIILKILILQIFLIFLVNNTSLSSENTGQLSESFLHPVDNFTGETFKKGEWLYGQPVVLFPGWFFWGISDRLTVELDIFAWLLNIKDINIRWCLLKNKWTGISIESMLIYLPDIDDLEPDKPELTIRRTGNCGYVRLNATFFVFTERIKIHCSTGQSYSDFLLIRNDNSPQTNSFTAQNYNENVYSYGFSIIFSPAFSFHASKSYGETFTYSENRPRKHQTAWGITISPFIRKNPAFFKNMHIELSALDIYYPDAELRYSIPIPLYPYLYWQWGF